MVYNGHMDNGGKSVKIHKIYEGYFGIIDSYFGGIKHHLNLKDQFPHIKLAERIAGYDFVADLILDATSDLKDTIEEYWAKNAPIVKQHLSESEGLKCIYSGDISPIDLEKFLKRTVLYIDTIILPDPITNLSIGLDQAVIDKRFYLKALVRHIFNVWRIKELVINSYEFQPLVIYPISFFGLEEKILNDLILKARNDYQEYNSQLFGISTDPDQLEDLFKKHPSAEDLYSQIKNPGLLPLRFRNENKFVNEFRGSFLEFKRKALPEIRNQTEAQSFAFYVDYQMKRTREQELFSNHFRAEPISDNEASWSFNNYVIGGGGIDSAILNSLQRNEFDWIGNVPISALGALRERGELEYMRNALRKGIHDIKTKDDTDLESTVKQLQDNMNEMFACQKAEVARLQEEVKSISEEDVPIEIGANLIGLLGWFGTAFGVVNSYLSIKDKLEEAKAKEIDLKLSPINFFIDAYEGKK